MADLNKLFDSIVAGRLEPAIEVTHQIIEEKLDIPSVINNYMIKAMEEIGDRFQNHKAYVPELLMAARAMKGSLELLKPHMKGEKIQSAGKIVIGTVFGDLHDIGKNLTMMMLKGAGFEIYDAGVDVEPAAFIDKAEEVGADIIGMSALLTTTMPNMSAVIEELKERGLRDKYIVMIGGAPVTDSFAEQIGADYYTPDAATCAEVARKAVQEKK